MAGRMNRVIETARKKGVLIIHCPSNTMKFYADSPGRKLAMAAPVAKPIVPLERWCYLDKNREGKLPIDDGDGGCDCLPRCKPGGPWKRQIATLTIEEGDAITDSAEAYYLMQQRGIDNVIVMGVHTNMCVLGRPFSIRQLSYQGKNVVLMRDMTDTMYNPRSAPFVSHFTGTDLVVAHIEKHWCPTITSSDFLSGKPFRFKNDKRPHLVVLCAEREYQTERTLPAFAAEQLGKDFRVSFVFAKADDRNDLPGIDVLKTADVMLISVRRRVLPKAKMQLVRQFIADGKPVIGIRTASHAFAIRGDKKPPAGHATFSELDADVFGGNYVGHRGAGVKSKIEFVPSAEKHPILEGVKIESLIGNGSLYRVSPLKSSTTPLLIGSIPEYPKEPVAWTNKPTNGGRVFYTSLGHPEDFELPAFRRLLKNGIYWAAGLKTSAP